MMGFCREVPLAELLISPASTAFQVVNVDMLARCDRMRGNADHLAVLDDWIAWLDWAQGKLVSERNFLADRNADLLSFAWNGNHASRFDTLDNRAYVVG